MAKSTSGKWVSRVGAAGGGKTYTKTRPGNFYGALLAIAVLGLALVVYSRYEYQNPVRPPAAAAPAIGSTLYAGLTIQACGQYLPYLNTDPTYKGGFIVQSSDVIKLSPAAAADAGHNATLARFVVEYPGLVATSTVLGVPTATGIANPKTTYKNGQVCAKTSKYPGKKGTVVYAYWKSFAQKKPALTTNPASIHFTRELRVAMAFEPAGVTPRVPTSTTTDQMVLATTTPTTTTTTPVATIPPSTTTTKPGAATTTTKPGAAPSTSTPGTTTTKG